MSVLHPAGRAARDGVPAGFGAMFAMTLLVALLQVALIPFIRVFDGIPDIAVALAVAIGLMRGPTAGAVVGFFTGLLVELVAPIGTLGVLALIYMAIGAFAGRYCGRPEASGLLAPIGLVVACAGAAQIAYAAVQLLLGAPFDFPDFLGRVLLAQMALSALLAPLVLLLTRQMLKKPVVLEPGASA
jgi:rod shape-determining protein MreD